MLGEYTLKLILVGVFLTGEISSVVVAYEIADNNTIQMLQMLNG